MKPPLPLIVFFAASAALAQAPHQSWRTITTPHFRVHYPAQYEAWAARAASRMESVRDAVVAEVGFAPEQVTDVLVVNPIAEANGETIPLLDTPRIVFFAEPPDPELQIGEYSDWIDLVAVHETAHLVHLLRPSRNPFERFFERFVPLNPIVLRAPRCIFEGYATVIEGRITGSGRPSGTMRAAILRKWALEGRLPAYAQLNSDRRFLGMSMAYLMGSAFLEWLEQRSGPAAMRQMWARLTARQRRSFDEAFTGVYGEKPDRLYGRFVAELTESAVALARTEQPREGDLWQETTRGSGNLAVSPDAKSLAIVLRPAQGGAKLAILSTEANPEEEKTARRIETILRRDPQDVAPVRARPLPRKPVYTLTPPDGGDISDPRWTRDGASIIYTHKQPDRDGDLHHDLFRWTPATGENVRLTRFADVKDADPLPDGKRAVAVRDRFGLSQLVFVDLATGAVTPMNEPSLDVVYTHPRASADGRLAWAEHRGGPSESLKTGVWRVVVDGKPLPAEGAFSPEWGKDGLYQVVAGGGWIDIVKDGSQITRSLGAAIDPAPSPDGSLYFMSLEPDGFVVRKIVESSAAESGRRYADRSYVPALPPAPATPVALRNDPVASRPYGFGRQEMSTLFSSIDTPSGDSLEFGVRFGDVVGRLDTLLIGATGGGALPRGAALAAAWRGWPVNVSAHLFHLRRDRGAELRGEWRATFPSSRLAISGGALRCAPCGPGFSGLGDGLKPVPHRAFLEGSLAVRQRRMATERVDVATDSAQHLRASARAALRGGGYELAAVITRGRRVAVGGVASSIEPESLFIGRILDPALDRDALVAERYHGERVELRSGSLTAFWQRHQGQRTLDLTGIEATLARDPLPIVKAAGLDLTLGIARVRQERRTSAWLALRWRP